MSSVLLHTCCAPCASVCVERLKSEQHTVTLFFSNANIGDPVEYTRRLDAVHHLASHMSVPLIVDDAVKHDAWLTAIRGFEAVPEGGARCHSCFAFSLNRTATHAAELGFDHFTTSLTVSPHKHTATIFELGQTADPVRHLPINFKQRNGFQRSVEISRELDLYRQNYCGCEFSRSARLNHA